MAGRALLVAALALVVSTLLGTAAHAVPSVAPGATAGAASAASTTTSSSAPSAAVTGLVFGDANANGRADSGEGLSGFTINLLPSDSGHSATATTGAGGRFAASVSPGRYYISGSGHGWYVIARTVTLHAGTTLLDLRAVRPLKEVLAAALHFTAKRYVAGDTAHIVATLHNTGSKPLRQITAGCNRAGDPDGLSSGAGWGRLSATGPGVTIAAHGTFTATVTNRVPAAARRFGHVVVACDFGYRGVDVGYRPRASDTARVPGPDGAVDGTVYRQVDQSRVAGARVVLVSPDTCPVLRRETTTNAQGRFHFTGLAPGLSYLAYVYPPAGLRVKGDDPFAVLVLGGETAREGVTLVSGTADVPEPSTSCASTPTPSTPAPASTQTTGPVLAETGADPSMPVLVGAITILAGLGLLAGPGRRRRRRAH